MERIAHFVIRSTHTVLAGSFQPFVRFRSRAGGVCGAMIFARSSEIIAQFKLVMNNLGILFPSALSKSRPLRNLRRLRPIRVLVLGPGFLPSVSFAHVSLPEMGDRHSLGQRSRLEDSWRRFAAVVRAFAWPIVR
jgi:hypothetical protein